MTRISSQLTFCSPDRILRKTVVERDEQNVITRLFSLDDTLAESSQTLFFDGILSSEIVSLKQSISPDQIEKLIKNYEYLDLSAEFPTFEISDNKNRLLLDFGTNSTTEINSKLARLVQVNSKILIFDLIASCVYYPALIIGLPAELALNRSTGLLLWENADLINKLVTVNTKIREVS